jgi:hypothetical protein
VLFYSTSVLQPIVPDRAGLIGIGIALLNVIMTLPPMFLVDVSRSSLKFEKKERGSDTMAIDPATGQDPVTILFAWRNDRFLRFPFVRPEYAFSAVQRYSDLHLCRFVCERSRPDLLFADK